MTPRLRRTTGFLTAVALLASVPGCQLLPRRCGTPPLPPPPQAAPKELDKTILPDYIIEPPDVLAISVVSLIPRQPYQLRPLDVLRIQASGLPPESSLAGDYPVGLDGKLVIGSEFDYVENNVDKNSVYQPIQAAGRQVDEIRAELESRLAKRFNDPRVSVSLISIAAQQDIAGEHLVAPDGKITLGSYGRVQIVGMTIEEAKQAIEAHLETHYDQPNVSLDIYGYNSKVFYVITQGAGLGDQVVRFPIKGNETALDAVAGIQGLTSNSSMRMWIARPGFNDCGGDQIMPVDWLGITQRGDVRTNYQILPGDRLYVAEDRLVALDTALAKLISPVERILGVTLLGVQTGNSIATFGQNDSGVGF